MTKPNWADVFHHMANPALAGLALVPEKSEQQVAGLVSNFEQKISLPFAPNVGAHGLVFGEWGHGKSQVLYRVARALASHADRCLAVVLVPENLAPEGMLEAAAAAARKLRRDDTSIRNAIERVRQIGSGPDAIREVATVLSDWASQTGLPHAALLFDEAQTLDGAKAYQSQLQELRNAFDTRQVVLHTLQCHSMVSLDRARELGQALSWLQGPNVSQVFLSSLDEEQTTDLLRARVVAVLDNNRAADEFFASGWTKALCRLVGGNPRKVLLLAQRIAGAMEQRGATAPTGEDVVAAATLEAGPKPGSHLFDPDRLRRICELLPQVWPQALGKEMAGQLQTHIGAWFGEAKALDIAAVAARMGKSVADLNQVIRRPVAGQELFEVRTDPIIDLTTIVLSFSFWDYLSAPFEASGGIDEKQAQYRLLLTPGMMQREVADALSMPIAQARNWNAFDTAAVPTPLPLSTDSDQLPLRGYRAQVRAGDAPDFMHVLVAPMLGKKQWPENAKRSVEKRLADQSEMRAVLLDFIVEEEEESAEPWPDQPKEKSRIVRIDYRQWARIDGVSQEPEEQSLSVRAARLCAAILGHAAALARGIEPSDSQKNAVGQILQLVDEALPKAGEIVYLPDSAQRQILELPTWHDGARLSLKQIGSGVTTARLTPLVPHYLAKDGARWHRQPVLNSPLGKLMREMLRRARAPIDDDGFAEAAQKELLIAQRAELRACVAWLADALVEAGEASRELHGLVFENVDAKIKGLQKDVAAHRRRVKEELQSLMNIRRDRWLLLRNKLDHIAEPKHTGRAQLDALESVKNDLSHLEQEIATAKHEETKEVDKLIEDASQRAAELNQRASKVHVIWRDALKLDHRLSELTDAVSLVRSAQGTDRIDRYGAVRDAHATFEGRYRGLLRLFEPAEKSSERDRLASLGLGRPFREVRVEFVESKP